MSRLTDRISYLQGLAEGMKLNPDKDSHKLIIGILEVLGEVGESFEALAQSHGELSDYVESIDEDLADLEADLYDDEDEELAEEDANRSVGRADNRGDTNRSVGRADNRTRRLTTHSPNITARRHNIRLASTKEQRHGHKSVLK